MSIEKKDTHVLAKNAARRTRFFSLKASIIFFVLSSAIITSSTNSEENLHLLWNQPAARDACPDLPSYAWVEHEYGEECIRYFSSEGVHGAEIVLIGFYGDRNRIMRRSPEEIPGNTYQAQKNLAERRRERLGIPSIIVARPGTYGSSGNHQERRQPKEFHSLNSAIDIIRERYNINRFTLLGHSGGATAAAALLTLGRDDIQCAVLTSGAYDLIERASRLSSAYDTQSPRDTTGLAHPYDPIQYVEGITDDPSRSIYILGNTEDRITPYDLQQRFFQAILQEGHNAIIQSHPAQGPSFHNLSGGIGLRKAAKCSTQGQEELQSMQGSEVPSGQY